MTSTVEVADGLSIARGIPLSEEEQELVALTLGGYLREVTTRFGPHEAACMRSALTGAAWIAGATRISGCTRWTLRARSLPVASARARASA